MSAGDAAALQSRAGAAAAALPALMLSAERLAAMIAPGAHGLRRAGPGEDFWQYRPAHSGDTARAIDWRRSARSDAQFVRDREAQTAQAAAIWVSGAAGMDWRGGPDRPTKRDRAQLLALALGLLLLRGGEKVALADASPRAGRAQADRLAQGLLMQAGAETPPEVALRPNRRLVLLGDFLGDPTPVTDYLARAAAIGLRGVMMQVLDPDEEAFPYDGAVLFRAPSGAARHETRDAGGLRGDYLARLAARRDLLRHACDGAGWHFGQHVTGAPPAAALIWLHQVLGD